MNTKEILAIKNPGVLFPSPETVKADFNELVKKWHPDVNGSNGDAFIHIKELREEAERRFERGVWFSNLEVSIVEKSGIRITMPLLKYHKFELGDMFILEDKVIFVLEKKYEDLFNQAQTMIRKFKFGSVKMEQEVHRYLPTIQDVSKTIKDEPVMTIKRNSDLVLLKDVLEYYGGVVPERHVAWIMSTLHNLLCYFFFADITHNGISIDTYFISPELHGGSLLGGWWYSVDRGDTLLAVPPYTWELLPMKVKDTKKASAKVDLELIKAVGRELLGDRQGGSLLSKKVAPPPLINWLRCSTSGSAYNAYETWNHVLTESFGKRQFVEMKINSNELYGRGE